MIAPSCLVVQAPKRTTFTMPSLNTPEKIISRESSWPVTLALESVFQSRLKPYFKVAWIDEANPGMGFEYLYLTEEDYKNFPKARSMRRKSMKAAKRE